MDFTPKLHGSAICSHSKPIPCLYKRVFYLQSISRTDSRGRRPQRLNEGGLKRLHGAGLAKEFPPDSCDGGPIDDGASDRCCLQGPFLERRLFREVVLQTEPPVTQDLIVRSVFEEDHAWLPGEGARNQILREDVGPARFALREIAVVETAGGVELKAHRCWAGGSWSDALEEDPSSRHPDPTEAFKGWVIDRGLESQRPRRPEVIAIFLLERQQMNEVLLLYAHRSSKSVDRGLQPGRICLVIGNALDG